MDDMSLDDIINSGNPKYASLAKVLEEAEEKFRQKEINENEYQIIIEDISRAVEIKSHAEDVVLKANFLKVLDGILKLL